MAQYDRKIRKMIDENSVSVFSFRHKDKGKGMETQIPENTLWHMRHKPYIKEK